MICETMIVPLKWQRTQSGEKNGSLRFGPIKPVLYVIIHFSFRIYAAVCFHACEEKRPSQKMADVSAEHWSRGWRVQVLRADCPTGIPQGYVTLVVWWKWFSWPLSTAVPSCINRDNHWLCHADLDRATVKPLVSEFYKAKKHYFLLILHAPRRSAGGSAPHGAYSRTQVDTAAIVWTIASHHTRGERAQEGCLQQAHSPRNDPLHFPS